MGVWFHLKKAGESTQRRKVATTQRFRLLATFSRWGSKFKPVFPLSFSHLRLCLLASLRYLPLKTCDTAGLEACATDVFVFR
jgi:hypothetical protein